jgi:Protein of unknown function (DUF3619)
MNERKFGYQIKQKLDQALDLEPATLNRLRTAREQALARQRMTEPVFVLAWADAVLGRLSGNAASASIALAGAALILALVGIQYWQQAPTVEEIEEIDAAILTGDLPINAYLDKSFDTWLKRSPH